MRFLGIPVFHHRGAGNDFEAANARQVGQQVVVDALGKIGVVGVRAAVVEGQHGDGLFADGWFFLGLGLGDGFDLGSEHLSRWYWWFAPNFVEKSGLTPVVRALRICRTRGRRLPGPSG